MNCRLRWPSIERSLLLQGAPLNREPSLWRLAGNQR